MLRIYDKNHNFIPELKESYTSVKRYTFNKQKRNP